MVHAGHPFSQPSGSHADEGPASGCQDQCPLLGGLYSQPRSRFRVNRHVTFNFEAAYNRIKVFNIDTRGAMITPEVRYWFSARPQTGHFVGIAGIGCHYNYERGGNRHKGDLYGGGVTYGYSFVLSRRWSLETTLGVGMAHVQEMSWDKDEYEPGEANVKGWRPIPIKAGVTFVYLIK